MPILSSSAKNRESQPHDIAQLPFRSGSQIALAGEVYAEFVAEHEDNPGHAEAWLERETESLLTRYTKRDPSKPLTIMTGENISAQRRKLLEGLYGTRLSNLLDRKGLVINHGDRGDTLHEVAIAAEQAKRQLRQYAQGDYRPDPDAARFPVLAKPKAEANPSLTVSNLVDAFLKAKEGKLAYNTVKRYDPSLRSLAAFLGPKAAADVTDDHVYDWMVHRRDVENITPRTVNKNDQAAVSSMFKWATEREGGRKLSINPAKGLRLDVERLKQSREKGLRSDEVAAILNAALAVEIDRQNPTASFANKWCPWLAAYSGARITELTRLRGDDIRQERNIWVMTFLETKTSKSRTVPIHPHVLELGFVEFVQGRGRAELFYDPTRHSLASKTHPAEIRSRKVADWVRSATGLTMDVQANHAWRHTWKTRALEAGIELSIRDAVTGHNDENVGRGYEEKSVLLMAEAMKRFRRYDL